MHDPNNKEKKGKSRLPEAGTPEADEPRFDPYV